MAAIVSGDGFVYHRGRYERRPPTELYAAGVAAALTGTGVLAAALWGEAGLLGGMGAAMAVLIAAERLRGRTVQDASARWVKALFGGSLAAGLLLPLLRGLLG